MAGSGPPEGGRQDHDAMRAASIRPRELEPPPAERAREPIPGERDATTLTHREPGAIGGQFAGGDTPSPDPRASMNEETARERAREGGG